MTVYRSKETLVQWKPEAFISMDMNAFLKALYSIEMGHLVEVCVTQNRVYLLVPDEHGERVKQFVNGLLRDSMTSGLLDREGWSTYFEIQLE